MGHIGRLWHRMYPIVRLVKNPQDEKPKPRITPRYLELLTIFPDNCRESKQFIQFLTSESKQPNNFQKLW